VRFCVRAGADASKKRPIEERGEAPSKRANLGDADGADKPKAIKVLLMCPCRACHARPTCIFPASRARRDPSARLDAGSLRMHARVQMAAGDLMSGWVSC
jgi:hypothetical protein